ncbi:MAG: transcription termination factor NusA [Vampirovibrionales bacterium]
MMAIRIGATLMENVEILERERGISKELILSSLKDAMLAAYKRYAELKSLECIVCQLNEKSGEIAIVEQRKVVEALTEELPVVEVSELSTEEPMLEATHAEEVAVEAPQPVDPFSKAKHQIVLKEARRLQPDIQVGEILEIDQTPEEFGRLAAGAAKQVITQRIRDAERALIAQEFEERRHTVGTGIIQRIEGQNVIISIGKTETILPKNEQVPGEAYRVGNKIRVFILEIREIYRGVPQIVVTQKHPFLVREVFELEVPEIEDGVVEIRSIAREAGLRTKVAVWSNDPNVDPQGACIGKRGSRIQAIVNELKNEKIDIIRWSQDPIEFIHHALAPAKILNVQFNPDTNQALVVVPDEQLSLAIGREGVNVRLASRLTGVKLDIKSLSQAQKLLSQAQAHEPHHGHDAQDNHADMYTQDLPQHDDEPSLA